MAQKSQQAYLSVGTTAGSTKTITGISNASQGVVTSSAHGQVPGTVGIITGVVGMTQVNNRAFVANNTASPTPANTFILKGVKTTTAQGYGTYTSGGIWTPYTMTEVGEVTGISTAFDGEAADIDVTNLRSTGKEYLTGLPEFGNVSLTLTLPSTADAGQVALRDLREVQSSAPFTITLASGLVAAFVGLVKSFAVTDIVVDGAVKATCTIKVSNQPAFFA
jgi:hypothetical protein